MIERANMPDATLQDQVQDIPLWWLILFLVLASLAGELYRADQRQRITRGLLVRVGVRALAASVIGVIALLYCTHRGMDIWSIGAVFRQNPVGICTPYPRLFHGWLGSIGRPDRSHPATVPDFSSRCL